MSGPSLITLTEGDPLVRFTDARCTMEWCGWSMDKEFERGNTVQLVAPNFSGALWPVAYLATSPPNRYCPCCHELSLVFRFDASQEVVTKDMLSMIARALT